MSNLYINNNASVPPPSITVNGSSNAVVAPGATITVAVANGPGNPTDWVAIYRAGDTNNSDHLSWVFLNGTQTAPSTGVKSATVTMSAPTTNGSYEARFYANNTYTLLVSVTFTVQASAPPPPPPPPPSSPSITVNGSSSAVVTPGATITVAVANGPGNPTDWVAIYKAGDTNNYNHLSWVYLNGTQTAPSTGVKSATVTMSAPTTNGSYEARFYANNTYTLLVSVTFTVQASAPPPPPPPPPSSPSITVNGSSSAVVTPGATITVAVANGSGNPTDWVAIYKAGDTNNSDHLSWVFLNGTQTAPSTGVKSATVTMSAPTTNGSYEARFYANNTYTLLVSVTFTVQVSAPPPPPPPPPSSPSITVNGSSSAVVTPGATITVAVANGPGNPTDWVAIYKAGDTNNSDHLSWVFLNGTQTAPSTGVKSATVTMSAPTTNGSYEARFYANNTYTLLVSVTFTVQASAPPPPPPPPPSSPSITVNGSSSAVVTPGATITVAVANGPGNPTDWVAIYKAGDTNNSDHLSWVYLNGTQTPPSTGVKSATVTMTAPTTNGSYEARFYANDTYTLLARVTFSVQGVGTPTAITLSPANATVPDNAPAGTVIATANVTMSDGSQFAGTLATSDTNFFAISGLNIVTARAFTSADDGTHSTVITASQGGQAFSIEFSV